MSATLEVKGGDKTFVRSVLVEINGTGDTKVMWNPRDKDEVENARKSFDRLEKRGFRAFKVNKAGAAGERLTAFDPAAEKIIMVPQLAGG